MTQFSKSGTLDARDIIKTAIVTTGTGLLTSAVSVLQSGAPLSWTTFKPVLLASVCAGITYLLKQLGTNSEGQLAKETNN